MNKNYQSLHAREPMPKDYEVLNREELKNILKVFIADLIEHQFEKLCNMAYRHDIPESKFTAAMVGGSVLDQAGRIADLVIERELQKVESRKAYRAAKQKKELD